MEFFEHQPLMLFMATGVVGLIIGSFLNVVTFRVPIMIGRVWRKECADLKNQKLLFPLSTKDGPFNLWRPGSCCPHCSSVIPIHHNVPLISYFWLRGLCAFCGKKISLRYPMMEMAAALASLGVAWAFGPTWQTLAALFFTWALLALAVIDIESQLLPDSITLPLLWTGILVSLFQPYGWALFADLRSSVIGSIAGYLSLWGVSQLFKLATGREGMGRGDFKLLAAIGAWLGWQVLPFVILIAAFVGTIVGITMMVLSDWSRTTRVSFGPYLAGAGWTSLFFGDQLMDMYLKTLG